MPFGGVVTSLAGPLTAVPAAVSGSSRSWLAGNPGPSPSPSLVVLTLPIVASAFVAAAVIAWPRQHREATLREQMRAGPVTFKAGVVVQVRYLGMMLQVRGPLHLVVCGDLFRVAQLFPPAWVLFGQRYCYRAEDTTVKVVTGWWHDWIEIEGQQAGTAARIRIWRRGMNRQIWNALIGAGAHPIGPAPPP